jgi:hypothetical protein
MKVSLFALWQLDPMSILYTNKYPTIRKKQRARYNLTKRSSLGIFFFGRIYIKVFDQLELGITPDSLQLQNYFRPVDKKILDACKLDSFDIPKPDSKSPLIIFIDPEIDAALKVLYMVPLTYLLLTMIPYLKRYPKVTALIKGDIVLMYVHLLPVYAYMQSSTQFLSQLFINNNKSLSKR